MLHIHSSPTLSNLGIRQRSEETLPLSSVIASSGTAVYVQSVAVQPTVYVKLHSESKTLNSISVLCCFVNLIQYVINPRSGSSETSIVQHRV